MERCARCGEGLRPDANFCPHCGARAVREMTPGDGWEYCEIVACPRWIGSILPKRYIEVAIEGMGPEGAYHTPIEDGLFRKDYGDLGDEGKETVEAALRRLRDSGWEPTPARGGGWWGYHLRRFRPQAQPAFLAESDITAMATR